MRQRRERGDGALFYEPERDRWVGQLDLGRDEGGRRLRPKIIGRTRPEVRAKMDELRRQHEGGQDITARNVTFDVLAKLWLERGLPSDTAETTRDNYASVMRAHLLPHLGTRRVSDLRPEHLEKLLDDMAAAGYSGRTMRHVLKLCRRVLKLGERRGLVVRNVAAVVEAPRGPKQERYGLTVAQARTLLAEAQSDSLGNLITVSLLLGLRPGEAAGLTWGCVDIDGDFPTIRVAASLRRTRSGMVLVEPQDTHKPTHPRVARRGSESISRSARAAAEVSV